jgi:hypothetical protein
MASSSSDWHYAIVTLRPDNEAELMIADAANTALQQLQLVHKA